MDEFKYNNKWVEYIEALAGYQVFISYKNGSSETVAADDLPYEINPHRWGGPRMRQIPTYVGDDPIAL
jgi:hypothetical protein